MVRKIPFADREKYHIYNRGTEKRKIFLEDKDYERFIFILSEFNKIQRSAKILSTRKKDKGVDDHQPLVSVEDYSLMPNHYHVVLEQLEENGIAKFLQKVMTGYTMYFNKKYNRTGALFQGKTKSKHIDSDVYYNQLRAYIHLNPVELKDKNWKTNGKVQSIDTMMKFLNEYKWCSCKDFNIFKDYLSGKEQFLDFDVLGQTTEVEPR